MVVSVVDGGWWLERILMELSRVALMLYALTWLWSHGYTHLSELIKLYCWDLCILLYGNFTSIKNIFNHQFFLKSCQEAVWGGGICVSLGIWVLTPLLSALEILGKGARGLWNWEQYHHREHSCWAAQFLFPKLTLNCENTCGGQFM